MVLWKIEGIARSGDSAGALTLWTVTLDAGRPPDADLALAAADGRAEWFEVISVRAVVAMPRSWTDQGGRPELVALAEAAEDALPPTLSIRR